MIRGVLRRLFGSGFGDPQLSLRVLFKHVVVQKVLRINAHVPWPVHWTTRVLAPSRIDRGSRFPGLSAGCHIDGRNGIQLGRNVWIGPRVSLVSQNHDMCDYSQYVAARPIVVGDDCWLGVNSVVLPAVELGNHVVVAAGAVVTKSFPLDDVLLAGVPARVIRNLAPYKGHQ